MILLPTHVLDLTSSLLTLSIIAHSISLLASKPSIQPVSPSQLLVDGREQETGSGAPPTSTFNFSWHKNQAPNSSMKRKLRS